MFLAVTIHNIPEGLTVGIAFGVALANPTNNSLLIGALLLAIGIGIQNIPEGAVVSLPIKAETTMIAVVNHNNIFAIWERVFEANS
jgi:ZIP family zinc transporter